MAQSGFTPISIYYSSTASAVPLAANLAFGELALNILDGRLYYKSSTGVVTLLSSSAIAGGVFTTLSYSTSFTGTAPATITANSSSAALRVTQTGAGNSLLIEDSANPDSTPFVVDSAGRVVVGHTAAVATYQNPQTGTLITPWSQIQGTTSALSLAVTSWSNVSTASFYAPAILLSKSASATVGTQAAVVSGEVLGTITFSGDDGTSFVKAAQILSAVDGTPGTNDMPGRLVFSTTADGSSLPTERMRITSAGVFGFNSTNTTGGGSGLYRFAGDLTGAASSTGIFYTPNIKSDVSTASVLALTAGTEDAAFTVSALNIFFANQGTITGGSRTPVTIQSGFVAASSMTGATSNYGFNGQITSGTGRYNLYMAGSADNFLAGSLGIGGVPVAGSNLYITKAITGAANSFAIRIAATAQSDSITAANGVSTAISTAAGAYTIANMYHTIASQGSLGGGSIISNQYGYTAGSNFTGATLNAAFSGNLNRPTQGTFTGSTALNVSQSGTTVTVTTTANHNLVTNQVITIALTANATALVSGVPCTILTVGSTDYTLIGAASNTVGVSFVATGAGTGTGTVTLNSQGSGAAITNTGLTTFTYVSTSATFAAVTVLTGAITISSRYNLYCNGTADNYMNGALGIGALSSVLSGAASLYASKAITGTGLYGIFQAGAVQSDVTGSVVGIRNSVSTQAASYTIANYTHFATVQGTIGAGSSITSQTGFYSSGTLIAGINNYAFLADNAAAVTAGKTAYGFYAGLDIATGGGTTWGFYGDGTANNYMAGRLWLGSTAPGQVNFANYLDITGATVAWGNVVGSIIRSPVTSSATLHQTIASTEAAAFTLASVVHYAASQSTFANTGVTTQQAFQAQSNLTGATNNFGFVGSIPAGTNRYNLYCSGTANNYMAGSLGIGNLPSAGQTLFLNQSITGNVNSTAVRQQGTVDLASVTTSCFAFDNVASTTATAATLPTYIHYNSQQGTFGAGSTVTSQIGFASASTMIGATNNFGHYAADTAAVTAGKTAYGFYSLVNTASGGGTAYGFFAAGTAPNVFHNIGVTSTLGYTTGGGGVVTQGTSRATAVTLNKASGQITMFTAAGSATWATFQVNNSLVAATDTVLLSVNGATNSYVMTVSSIAAGAFIILFSSVSGTASDTPKINFTVIKGAIS